MVDKITDYQKIVEIKYLPPAEYTHINSRCKCVLNSQTKSNCGGILINAVNRVCMCLAICVCVCVDSADVDLINSYKVVKIQTQTPVDRAINEFCDKMQTILPSNSKKLPHKKSYS